MIKPEKHFDLQLCPLNIATHLLSALRTQGAIPLVELDEHISERLGADARPNFVPAMNLLFVLGLIRYDETSDVVVFQFGRVRQ